MKIGINAWSLPANLSLEETFKCAKEAGFETIELNMAEDSSSSAMAQDLGLADTHHLTMSMDEQDLKTIKKLASDNQLPISSISTALHWQYPLNSSDPTTREQGKVIVKKMIDACAYLGGDTVLVVPGAVTVEDDYETCYNYAQEAFKELAPYAAKNNIVIGVENVWNKFLYSPLEMRQFIDEINHPNIQVYFDAGNVLQFGYPEQWVRILGKRIAKVHVKDFKTSIGNITGFTNLLAGDLDWPKLMEALNDIGYNGPITAELSPYTFEPAQLAIDTANALRKILKMS